MNIQTHRYFSVRRGGLSLLALVSACLVSAMILFAAHTVIRGWQLRELGEHARGALDLYTTELGLTLARFESAPKLIARHPDVMTFLSGDRGAPKSDALNRLLERLNDEIGASDVYVMDTTGLTLVASNWRSEKTFIGKSFEYRPYFTDAMAGENGRFFGLGTTSGVRGHYFSAPVRSANGEIVGVVTVKVPSAPLESLWSGPGRLIVTDEFGIVFLSSDRAWLYGGMRPMTETERARLIATKRYDLASVRLLPIETQPGAENAVLIRQADAVGPSLLQGDHLMVSRGVPVMAAQGAVIVPTRDALFRTWMLTMLSGFAVASLWLVALALVQYRSNLAQRRRFEDESRQQLETWAAELEARVAERTAALSASNEALSVEIAERERMGHELRETQSDLIQAEKMAALGEISAGINHELNQPLGAVRAYADNAVKFLTRGDTGKVAENLKEIADLCDRMGRIVRDLKIYSRKDPVSVEPIGLRETVAAALRIVRHRLSDLKVSVSGLDDVPDIAVVAAETGLTQVLTNLFSNAADAMSEGDGPRRLDLFASVDDETVILTLKDSGPGIPDTALDRLFDPFFSTKKGEKGLGLGLAISRKVMRGFGGDLSARNDPAGGAQFSLVLKRTDGQAATVRKTGT